MNSVFRDLITLLNRFGPRYLVVGGYAVMLYSEPRYTKDSTNLEKLIESKRATGRPQDLVDLKQLEQAKKRPQPASGRKSRKLSEIENN